MESATGLVKTDIGGKVLAGLRGLGRGLLDQLFPPVCLACRRAVGTPDGLCSDCWSRLRPISAPHCPVLGLPFTHDLGPEALSIEALSDPPPFARARAAVAYTDLARKLVSRLKYGDRPEIAGFCGRMMTAAGRDLLAPDAVLVPVPLHFSRHFSRRYNQSAELAGVVAMLSGLPVDASIVRRKRRTEQQVGLNARQRARNVEGAFAVRDDALARLDGRRVVLVDDVLTTGATVSALSRVLLRTGVVHVDVLCFARVVLGTDMTL